MTKATKSARRGRPPVGLTGSSVGVHVRLSPQQFDDAYRRARVDRVTIPEFLRRILVPKIDKPV